MILQEGDRIRLTLTAETFPPFLVWRDDRLGPLSPTLATAGRDDPGTVTIEWTATFSGFYEAVLWKSSQTPAGDYTLRIERLN